MARSAWKYSEVQFIIDNYATMTTEELCESLGRSKKSVNRKIEVLRDSGKIGHREQETVNRAYRQRTRGSGSSKSTGRRRGLPVEDYGYEEV